MTTNPERPYVPERLYACHLVGGGFLADDVIDVVVLANHETDGPVAEYVRADKAETETTALRRERDALLAERDAVAREGWRACVLGVSIIRFWQAETKSRSGDQRGALALMNEAVALRDIFTADDKAAGKGVG